MMKALLISQLLNILFDKRLADFVLDAIEDKVKQTESKTDDLVILAITKALRATLDIPDNDGPTGV